MKLSPNIQKLGDAIEIIMGQAPPSKMCNKEGKGVPFVKVGEFGEAFPVIREWTTLPHKLAADTDVLLCVVGATIGRINFGIDCSIGRSVAAIRPLINRLDQRYLYYFLSGKTDYLRNTSQGAAQTVITKVMIANLDIPLPPLPEQQRIVSILDQAFAAIDKAKANAEKNLKNAKELFESYLQGVFEKKGEGWEEKRLEEILISPPKNGWSPPAKNHSDSGVPVLTLSAVTGFQFKPNCIKYTDAEVNIKGHYWIANGDLLITRSNTPELVGHVGICSGLKERTIYPDLMMKINPDESMVLSKYLYYQLRSPKLRQIIMESAHGANPTMKKINKQDVQGYIISYPSLIEQQDIIQDLEKIEIESEKLETLYQRKLNELEELKKSILQKAFSGELITNKEPVP